MEETNLKNIEILELSEIKLTLNNQNFVFKNNSYYKCLSNTGQSNPYGCGVLLLI